VKAAKFKAAIVPRKKMEHLFSSGHNIFPIEFHVLMHDGPRMLLDLSKAFLAKRGGAEKKMHFRPPNEDVIADLPRA